MTRIPTDISCARSKLKFEFVALMLHGNVTFLRIAYIIMFIRKNAVCEGVIHLEEMIISLKMSIL